MAPMSNGCSPDGNSGAFLRFQRCTSPPMRGQPSSSHKHTWFDSTRGRHLQARQARRSCRPGAWAPPSTIREIPFTSVAPRPPRGASPAALTSISVVRLHGSAPRHPAPDVLTSNWRNGSASVYETGCCGFKSRVANLSAPHLGCLTYFTPRMCGGLQAAHAWGLYRGSVPHLYWVQGALALSSVAPRPPRGASPAALTSTPVRLRTIPPRRPAQDVLTRKSSSFGRATA